MKKSINLLSGKKQVSGIYRKIFYGTIVAFLVVVTISMSLIGLRLALKASYDSFENREKVANTQLLAQQENKDKLLEIKSRLSEIKKILARRSPVTIRMDTLSSVVPNGSSITTLNGDETEMLMTIESDSISSLNYLMELKIKEITADKKKGIKRVELRSFDINPDTLKYSATFGIQFI